MFYKFCGHSILFMLKEKNTNIKMDLISQQYDEMIERKKSDKNEHSIEYFNESRMHFIIKLIMAYSFN